jgi:serine/threonine protein kinase
MQQLPKNTFLQGGKYKIEKVLGQGGFGITYLATQELLDRKVCIKEFFFKDSCSRNAGGEVTLGTIGNRDLVERFLNKFIKEARTLSQLDHPNIIRILDIFKENGTAYYVMDYIEGSSLEDIVNSRGALSESEAITYIKQVANALEYIHQRSINHLDVKPANIMVRRSDNKAILIDFGVSKQYDSQGEQTSTTPVGISYGYAPIEQYRPGV